MIYEAILKMEKSSPISKSLSRIKSNQMHFDHAAPSVADWINLSSSSFRMERLDRRDREATSNGR